jgi:small redox-active disulfide protein 2
MSAFVRAAKPAAVGVGLAKGQAVSTIQILGTGCKRCRDLTANAEKAVQELGIEMVIEKVTEIQDIIKFQILMTPGLVIDGQVKAAGRVPSVDEIKQMLLVAEATK